MNKNINNKDSFIGIITIGLISMFFLSLAFYANTDLINGRYAIFMDEQIIFDGVDKILQSSSTGELIKNIVGGDHRYGRILYYLSAYFSAIPQNIFGESGQIVATRLLQTIILMSAYLILSLTFFNQWKMRVLSFSLLLLMPTTLYYFTMPKPEPLQALFIALFLWQAKKHDFKLGWYWIFIGLAFGAKISVAPYLLAFGILALYQQNNEVFTVNFWKLFFTKTLPLFLLGFFIAEPILLTGRLQQYLNSTFRNTTHGSDDKSITILSWIEFIYTTLSPVFTFLLFIGFSYIINYV